MCLCVRETVVECYNAILRLFALPSKNGTITKCGCVIRGWSDRVAWDMVCGVYDGSVPRKIIVDRQLNYSNKNGKMTENGKYPGLPFAGLGRAA